MKRLDPANGPIISARGLTKIYPRGREQVRALDNVDFDIRSGEFVAIVGPSGAGKSTLLNLIGCMDAPTAGSLTLFGQAAEKMTEAQRTQLRRERIGFVFQHFGLIPTLSVAENIALPALFARRRAGVRAKELLMTVGLSHRRDHRPHELSGGEMQRVAIARALMNDPDMLLADEPTGNLDTNTGAAIVELFSALNREGLTVVVITHNPTLASSAHRRIELVDGRVGVETRQTAEAGTALLKNPIFAKAEVRSSRPVHDNTSLTFPAEPA
jgi:ABC-type lipoprotein export system ATPase subunit